MSIPIATEQITEKEPSQSTDIRPNVRARVSDVSILLSGAPRRRSLKAKNPAATEADSFQT
jgi:hypothetical protein